MHKVLRSWRSWAAAAAGVWSWLVTVVGVLWATDVSASPFGRNDPRASDMGSHFEGLESTRTGLVVVAVGLAGTLTALAARRFPEHRWPAIPAACLSFALILIVPDVRVIQNFAYLFIGYTGLWDAALAAMVVAMIGGLLWALATVAQLAREPGSLDSVREPRWAKPVTYAAAVLALPYPIVRISWGLGIPLGVPGDYFDGWTWAEHLGVALLLGGLPVAGAILTIGLLRQWGQVFPRWIPGLRGRRVPIWAAVVPGLWAAAIISQGGIRLFTWGVSWDNWGESAPGLFFLPWGLTLAAAVYAYAVHRRRQDVEERRP